MPAFLQALGRLAVTSGGNTETVIATQPVRAALLLFIGIEGETTRQAACALLWPDSGATRARHTLSQTLYQLRADLGVDIIAAEGETLRASPSFGVDAVAFEEAVNAGRFADALRLYRGEFVPDIRLANTNDFETWVDRHRARYSRLHRRARRGEIERLERSGDVQAALGVARAWTELDPYEDEAWHRTIELLLKEGDSAGALHAYSAYAKQLAEGDVEPLEETTLLVEGLRRSVDEAALAEAAPARAVSESARGPRVLQVLGAAAVLLAVAAGVLGLVSRGNDRVRAGRRVLVTPLRNETADPALDAIGDMAADWIAQGLSWTGQLEVVPTFDVVPLGRDRPGADPVAPLDAARAAGADLLVSGRFYQTGDSLEFFARITDARSGAIWHALDPVRAAPHDPASAIDRLRSHVMGTLAARLTTDIPLEPPSVLHPPTYDAWIEYRRGAELFIQRAFQDAIPHLRAAATRDTDFVRPVLLEGTGWSNLGQPARADSVLATLARREERLTPYERAHLAWARADLAGDLDTSYDAARRAASLAPGGPACYIFGRLVLNLGRPREALTIFAELDAEPAWMPDWFNPWSQITAAHHALGEHERELDIARSASAARPRLWNALIEARALAALGEIDELTGKIPAWSERPPDGSVDFGTLLWTTATELRAHGHDAASDRVLEQTVRWLRDAVAHEPSTRHRWALLRALALSGRVAESTALLAGLRAGAPESVSYIGFEGVLAARFGDAAAAQAADARLAALDEPYLRGENTRWRAAIAAMSGDAARAIGLLEQSRNEGWARGFALHADPDFERIRGDPRLVAFMAADG